MESDGYQIPWKRGRDSSMVCRWDHCFTVACGQASDAERPGCCIQVTDKPMSHWCWKRLLSVSAPWHGLGSSAILLYRWPCDPRGAGLECTSMMKKTFFTFFLPKVSVMVKPVSLLWDWRSTRVSPETCGTSWSGEGNRSLLHGCEIGLTRMSFT